MHITTSRPASPAFRAGVVNAVTSLGVTGLALAIAAVHRRLCRRRELDARRDADELDYERFVTDFGPVDELGDRQVSALVRYCSGRVDRYVPSIAAEMLRGRPWNWRNEDDQLDEDHPRVQHLTDVVEGLASLH